MRKMILVGLVALSSGCVVAVREHRPPPPCPRAEWIPRHTDRAGVWHPGHWRCY